MNEPGEPARAKPERGEERRLHPLSLLLKLAALVPQLAIALLVVGTSTWRSGNVDRLIYVSPFMVLLFAGIGFLAWLRWARFSYSVGREDVRIKSGIVSLKARSIPYERIQDVNLKRGPLARLLGLAAVKLETGGSQSEEGVLDAVSLAEAERLRDLIRDRKAAQDGASAATSPAPFAAAPSALDPLAVRRDRAEKEDAGRLLFSMSLGRVLLAGIFNFSLVFLAILGALAQNLDFLLPFDLFDPRFWMGLVSEADIVRRVGPAWQIVGALGAVVSLIFVGLVTGILRTLLREYGFRLDRTESGFRRRRGLLTLTDVVMPLHRVQAAIVKTGPVRRRLGWYHLKFQSLARESKESSDHSVAPLARQHEMEPIAAEAKIELTPFDARLLRVSPAYWIVPGITLSLLMAAAIAVASLFDPVALIALPAIPLAVAAFYLSWRHHRYRLESGRIAVRRGFWGQRMTVLPLAKTQSLDIVQGPVARTLGLASLRFGVAGGSGIGTLSVDSIPREEAERLRERILAVVAQAKLEALGPGPARPA